jgi:hypothetical protein
VAGRRQALVDIPELLVERPRLVGRLAAEPALPLEVDAEPFDLGFEGREPRVVVGSVHDSSR